jgi:drug/metabolite transporter (DMT)-like permease
MNAEALTLAVAGALVHAFWNYSAKKSAGGLLFVWSFTLVGTVLLSPLVAILWLRQGHGLDLASWVAIAASAAIHITYALVLLNGYRESDFTVVYPLARGSGPLFAVLGAILLLGETPSPAGWLGIGCILGGIFLIAGVFQLRMANPRMAAGVSWGCLTGVCIASYTVVDGWAVKTLGMAPLLYYGTSLTARALLLAPFALADRPGLKEQWRCHWRLILIVGLCFPLSYSLVLYAMALAPVSYVAPVRELSMLIGLFFGARFLREALTPAHVAGTLLMVLGVLTLGMAT